MGKQIFYTVVFVVVVVVVAKHSDGLRNDAGDIDDGPYRRTVFSGGEKKTFPLRTVHDVLYLFIIRRKRYEYETFIRLPRIRYFLQKKKKNYPSYVRFLDVLLADCKYDRKYFARI